MAHAEKGFLFSYTDVQRARHVRFRTIIGPVTPGSARSSNAAEKHASVYLSVAKHLCISAAPVHVTCYYHITEDVMDFKRPAVMCF